MFADSHVLGHWYYMQLVNCVRKLDKNHTSWASVIVLGGDLFSLFETPRSVPNAGKTKQNTSFFGNNSLCTISCIYREKEVQNTTEYWSFLSVFHFALFLFYFTFETGFHVAEAGLEVLIFLPHHQKLRDYTCTIIPGLNFLLLFELLFLMLNCVLTWFLIDINQFLVD